MTVVDIEPSSLFQPALAAAGLLDLAQGHGERRPSPREIATLILPQHALLLGHLAHCRRQARWGTQTTYAVATSTEGPEAPVLMPDSDREAWWQGLTSAAECTVTVAVPFAGDETPSVWVERLQWLHEHGIAQVATAVLPLPRAGNPLDPVTSEPTGFDMLQMVALCRLLLDVPHVSVAWPKFGVKTGQIALTWGGDDWWGVAGADPGDAGGPVTAARLEELISVAGLVPVARSAQYTTLRS